jgi:hypothetical protein
MSAPKTRIAKGLMVKLESAYGTLPSMVVGTDGVQVAELFDPSPTAGFDGARPDPPGTGGTQVRLAPQGIALAPTFKVEAKGAGAAYSSSVYPRDFHALLQAAGFVATGSFTGGAEKYTYVPGAPTAAPSSFGAEMYLNGTTAGTWERWRLNGGYCDWTYEAENGAESFFTFAGQGRLNEDPVEQAVGTAITYAHTVLPPTAAPLTLACDTTGFATMAVRSLKIEGKRTITPRYPNENTVAGHGGFHPGRRAPVMTIVVEDPLFSTHNGWALWKAGTVLVNTTFQVGSTQYNRLKWTLARAQIMAPPTRSADGEIPLLEVALSLHTTTPDANDDVQLVVD